MSAAGAAAAAEPPITAGGGAARYRMISIPEAQETALSHAPLLEAEQVPLSGALGRVLAVDVQALDDLPPFPASIKDGFAVVASDGPGVYPVVGEARPGAGAELEVRAGSVAYITTGAPVPPGADAVVQVEDTAPAAAAGEGGGQRRVEIKAAAVAGQDIRPVGSDIRGGEVVLPAGTRVGIAEVGLLATVGAATVAVRRRPRLAVLSTGDEVVEPSTRDLGPGQIRDCNRAMLLAAAAAAGADVVDLGVARDVYGHLEGALDAALAAGADVLVTSGGVSMGDRDLLKPLLERRGQVHFGRVLMKPGKPLTFATLDTAGAGGGESQQQQTNKKLLVFGLPGNPVSSFVCFQLVVLPALRRMAGWASPQLRRVHAVTTAPLKLDPERPEYHRAVLQYGRLPEACGAGEAVGWFAPTTGNQISSRLLSARSANALLELPRRAGVLPAGSRVSALLIDDLGATMPQQPGDVAATEGFFEDAAAAAAASDGKCAPVVLQ